MAKPNVNYWVDAAIGTAFAVSAVSGLVFLLPVGQDGMATGVLGLTYRTWNEVHLWGSLAMIAGVLAHLVLHTKWIVSMTQRTFGRAQRKGAAVTEARQAPRAVTSLPRRRFLALGGVALAAGAVLATCGAAAGILGRVLARGDESDEGTGTPPKLDRQPKPELPVRSSEEASALPEVDQIPASDPIPAPDAPAPTATPVEATPLPVPTATPDAVVEMCVRCPRGLVNDPYPGRCRLYVDKDGDGLCDLSVPQPCG
jgi:hypothetical protein